MAGEVTLTPRTRELYHEFYRNFVQDEALFADMSLYKPHAYDAQWVDARFDRHAADVTRRCLCVMLGGKVIGDIVLHGIDMEKRTCELGICMVNDSYKNKGYGTEAEKLAVRYALDELGMDTVTAEVIHKNTRSQHVLEKAGFKFTHEDDGRRYYSTNKSTDRG